MSANCVYQPWKVHRLVAAIRGEGKDKIRVPEFQRSFVWGEEKRQAFIASLKSGFPVGSILLYRAGVENDQVLYFIVDGLQRCSTIKRYCDQSFKFFKEADVDHEFIDAVIAEFGLVHRGTTEGAKAVLEGEVRNYVRDWFRQRTSFNADDGYSNIELWSALCASALNKSNRSAAQIRGEFLKVLQSFLDRKKNEQKIDDYELPVIEFSGPQEVLPEVFERLNTGGTQLNKYDILAAKWDGKYVEFENDQLVRAVKEKYLELLELGYELDATDLNPKELSTKGYEYSLFEFVFAMGRVLKQKFPRLYGSPRKQSSEVDSIGFNLAALASGLPIQSMGEFERKLDSYPSVTRFFDALSDSSQFVWDKLEPIFSIKIDSEPRKALHTEFQMATFAAATFKAKYDEQLAIRSSWREASRTLRTTILQWFLYDNLRRYWKNAGDSKSYRAVAEGTVLQQIPREAMDLQLDAWYREQLNVKAKTVEPVTRLVLRYALSIEIDATAQAPSLAPAFVVGKDVMERAGLNPYLVSNVEFFVDGNPIDPALNGGGHPGRLMGYADAERFMYERFSGLKQRILESFFGAAEEELAS